MSFKTNSTYCSIITSNYFFYAKALYDSLEKNCKNFSFNLLVVDNNEQLSSYKGIQIINLLSIKNALPDDYEKIEKYENDKESTLRWALKPILLKYLVSKCSYNKAIFLDPDLFFYENSNFLFDLLDNNDVLITPHWRSKSPFKDRANFNLLFSEGLYNAGFFGCNSNSTDILDWWLKMCSYQMKKSEGFYVDQGFLNLFPIYYSDRVKIITHKGCNISNWNRIECQRTLDKNELLINGKFPIVFIHFTNATINNIYKGSDKILKPFLELYAKSLKKHNKNFKFKFEINADTKNKKSLIKKILIRLKLQKLNL